MKKLSIHQIELIAFFSNGGTVEFCTSVSPKLGDYHFPTEKPIKFSKTVFFSLVRIGLLKETKEEMEFGIRWSNFSISEKGIRVYNELEGRDENA